MKSLIFGTPGIPLSTVPRDTVSGIARVKELGLGAMELEFVQSVNVTPAMVPNVKSAAQKNDIILTCHGQYYVNLAAKEPAKREASIARMLAAARRVDDVSGWSVTWHLAFYQGQAKESVYAQVKDAVTRVRNTLHDEGRKVWIRPETTGKETQWGDLDEVIRLSQDVEGVMPCIDFAHLHARYNGTNNTLDEFRAILSKVESGLGKDALKNMHIQVCGIAYGPKGEKNHLPFAESDFNYDDMLKAWKEFKIAGVVITESPLVEKDAVFLQDRFRIV